MDKVTYIIVSTKDHMFADRHMRIFSLDRYMRTPPLGEVPLIDSSIPDNIVLCNGCNQNQYPGLVYAVYFNHQLHDVYCTPCRQKYFPEALYDD